MICLLLIMTVIFINSIESAEQKIRHPDTLLKEEDMSTKTKIWLLMVESGKVDQEELRRITPKSIFIAPLLSSHSEKCKEGYRHDHLGQCVKVIKIDPKVQLELLLQRLNQLYGDKKEEKKEEKEEEKPEESEVSNGPLHFSLPISNINQKTDKENNETKLETLQKDLKPIENIDMRDTETTPDFIPFPLPMIYVNQSDQIKDIESSGEEPLNVTEPIESSGFEGSGNEQVASGDGFEDEEETTTEIPVSMLSEETDYFNISETKTTTEAETQFTVTPSVEELITLKPLEEVSFSESYQNTTDTPSVNDFSEVLSKENIQVQKGTEVKNKSNPDRIVFPSDDENLKEELRTVIKPTFESSRIRFPDEISQPPTPSHDLHPESSSASKTYQTHSSSISQEQFWWLPKNWHIDDNQPKSPLVKVWSRLPLIHDVSYSREVSDNYKKSGYLEQPYTQSFKNNPQHKDKELSIRLDRQQPPTRMLKPFRSSRFQDILLTQRQHFRLQRSVTNKV